MARRRNTPSVTTDAVGSRNAAIAAPSQTVRCPGRVKDGGICPGSPTASAIRPSAQPARVSARCGQRIDMSGLLDTVPDRLPQRPRDAAGGARPLDEVLNQVLEDRRVQLVAYFLAAALRRDKTGITQHGEMPGHG